MNSVCIVLLSKPDEAVFQRCGLLKAYPKGLINSRIFAAPADIEKCVSMAMLFNKLETAH
jgi:hypothetical protein